MSFGGNLEAEAMFETNQQFEAALGFDNEDCVLAKETSDDMLLNVFVNSQTFCFLERCDELPDWN